MLRRPSFTDAGIALVGVALTEWVVWLHAGFGEPIAGPRWAVAFLPLLLDVPLAWRRPAPLTAWLLVVTGLVIHSLSTGNSAEGLEIIYPLAVGVYSVAAYAERSHAVVGLAAFIGGYAIFSAEDNNVRSGNSGQIWADAFFGVFAIAIWFAGVWMYSRNQAQSLAARASELERDAQAAVSEERARMARELHDIVSHNLSVVVLQAAGARAGGATSSTLEKIERSGREALIEMRRLLGVLRENGDGTGALAPQPGLAEIGGLAETIRAAGVPVDLDVRCADLPSAVELAVYRIVQEALTNVLKHAGPAHATVRVLRQGDAVVVEVVDDGTGPRGNGTGGHGLAGIRERVSLFGGEVATGPADAGGFLVRATLPIGNA
jgi:signal transduction histidine kinase